MRKIKYNSPVVLTFALLSLAALLLGKYTGGWTTRNLFCVYRAPLSDALTYPRFFFHVLGHADLQHYISNIMFLLLIGPGIEERYGSKQLLAAMAITAVVSGVVQFVFFPGSALLGASGIVFMCIVMLPMTGMKNGTISLTLILVIILYIGSEIIGGINADDNISQITHIIGGVCGFFIGLRLNRKKHR